ncbi:MAG: S8 family serine peptidase [Bdellovibrio sp.]|nr:S8 family serine peptidase [Bdellovibrio sp.]
MKSIMLMLVCLAGVVHAEIRHDYVVLFKEKASYKGQQLTRFTPYHSSYFDRLYQGKFSAKELASWKKRRDVQKIEAVYGISLSSIIPNHAQGHSNDPLYKWQWGIHNQGQSTTSDIDDIRSRRLNGADSIDIGGPQTLNALEDKMHGDVMVAVIDSGVDIEHPDLKNAIFRNMAECDAEGRVRFRPTDDRDQNGYIGDCHGWDFTKDNAKDGQRPFDDQGHGTHLSGILSMQRDNLIGGRGVSQKIKILPIKVSHGQSNGSGAGASAESFTDRVAKGILYATKMGAKVINLSLGWPRSLDTNYLREAVKEALNKNVLIVAAAGNNHSESPIFPCAYEGVLCVGAQSVDGSLSEFSNYGGAVDVLAPGDQILSTYPQKLTPSFFSVVGYEIKNGTSQAAPFISGLSAVLRGIFPDSSLDDLKAILLSWSSKNNETHETLFGLVHANLDLRASDFLIYPNFKEGEELEVNLSDLSFKFPLALQNLGLEQSRVEIKVEVQAEGVSLEQESFSLNDWKHGESRTIQISGHVANLQVKSEMRLRIVMGQMVFQKRIVLARGFEGNEVVRFDLPKSGINYLLPQKKGYASQLRTVQDFYRAGVSPEYYALKTTPNGSELFLFRPNPTSIKTIQAANPIVGRLLNFYQLDLNYDGTNDYLLVSLVQKESQRHLLYTFLDSNLRPMFGAQSSLVFEPEVAVFDPAHMVILPVNTKFGPVASLGFMAQGKVPRLDKNPDPFNRDEDVPASHFYYLYPDFEKGIMLTRIVDNYKLQQELSDRYQLEWQEKILIVGPLYQSKTLFMASKAYLQFEMSDGLQIRRAMVELGANFSTKIADGPMASLPRVGQLSIPLTRLNSDGPQFFGGTGYVSMQNDTMGSAAFYGQNGEALARFSLQHPFERDHILGLLAGARRGDSSYLFYQTKNNLGVIVKEDGVQKTHLHGIDRVSFLPGQVFNELFYPVVAGQGEEAMPAFYVDATQLNAGRIYVLTASSQGLESNLQTSIRLSSRCLALNPVSIQNLYHFVALCGKEDRPGEYEMRFLPMK